MICIRYRRKFRTCLRGNRKGQLAIGFAKSHRRETKPRARRVQQPTGGGRGAGHERQRDRQAACGRRWREDPGRHRHGQQVRRYPLPEHAPPTPSARDASRVVCRPIDSGGSGMPRRLRGGCSAAPAIARRVWRLPASAGAEAGEPPSTVDVFYHHIGSFRLCCSRVGGPVAGPGPPVARLSVLRLKRAPHPIRYRVSRR